MVWHIFKKDFRILWPLSLAVVLVGALSALRTPLGGNFDQSQSALQQLTIFLSPLLLLGIALVAIVVAHQDALPESQDDWLVRPFLRRDLALAKFVFVLLTVNIPLMVIDIVVQLALHDPLSVSVGVAAWRALLLVSMVTLPALMIGATTRSLANAFAFGIAAAIGFVLLLTLATPALSPRVLGFAGALGSSSWISLWAAAGVIVIGSAGTLGFQYSTRRTRIARSIGLATVFTALFMFILLPNTLTLAAQDSLWGPSNSDDIKLSFDPSNHAEGSGQEPNPGYRMGPPMSAVAIGVNAAIAASQNKQIQKVGLPLSISGLRPGDILLADRIEVRLASMAGKVLYEGAGVCTRTRVGINTAVQCSADRLEVRAGSASDLNEEELNLPIGLYQRIKNEPVRVEVSYALTRFVARSTQMINATDGLETLPELGSCATRIDNDGDEIQVGCLSDVGVPSCTSVVLEDPQTNRRDPELHRCNPNYGPYRLNGLKDAVNRAQLSIPFRDLTGLAHYPVDAAAITHSRVDLTVYDPVAHFRTMVTVPSVRLVEWAPAMAKSTAPSGY